MTHSDDALGAQLALCRTLAFYMPDTVLFVFDQDLNLILAEGQALRFLPVPPQTPLVTSLRVFLQEVPELLTQAERLFTHGAELGQCTSGDVRFEFQTFLLPVVVGDGVRYGVAIGRYLNALFEMSQLLAKIFLDLQSLRVADENLQQKLDVKYVCETSLQSFLHLTEADAIAMALWENDRLNLVNWQGETTAEAARRAFDNALCQARDISHKDAVRHAYLPQAHYNAPMLAQARGVMVVWLVRPQGVLGVLVLECLREEGFHENHVELAELFCSHVAVSLDHARLYEQTQAQLHEIQALYSKLREMEQLRTDMVRVAGHGIQSPLTNIFGYADLLETWYLSDIADAEKRGQAVNNLSEIRHAAERIQRISDGLLKLQNSIANQPDIMPTVFDVDELFSHVMQQFQSAVLKYGHSVSKDVEGALLIRADFFQVAQAIGFLVDNAIKYAKPRGHVLLCARQSDDGTRVLLTVEDDGVGIPPEYHEQVFMPLFRVRRSPQIATTEGLGLGLHLARSIAEWHQGGLTLDESIEDVGSAFTLWLPIYRP